MKKLYEMENAQDIAQQRQYLLGRMKADQKRVEQKFDQVSKTWKWIFNIGGSVSDGIRFIVPKLDYIMTGWSLFNTIFRRKPSKKKSFFGLFKKKK